MSGPETAAGPFAASRTGFEELVGWLEGTEATGLTHAELEAQLDQRGRELLRTLFQGQLQLRALTETRRTGVVDADGIAHTAVESGHTRGLLTLFGPVEVTRLAYRRRGHANLYPADADLNLPVERHSHGIRRLAAVEATRGSFEQAREGIERGTGQAVGKRQVEELTARAAIDVEEFYATREHTPAADQDVLVISADGKGIVMRPEALRPATGKAAAKATAKLATRLSKGEKRYRKRLAEVGTVYDLTPVPRTAAQIMTSHAGTGAGETVGGRSEDENGDGAPPVPVARARNKWLTASVVTDAADVLAGVFDEAGRRDPTQDRTWVALVDGNNHQIDRIRAEAAARSLDITIVIDFIHVLEYLWSAAWCFFTEADPAAEAWVRDRAMAVLDGQASAVATGLRRRATATGLSDTRRQRVDTAAKYLTNKAPYLDYPTALAAGWPIATGIIEGACRHLVKDRMDITGARWGLPGAEAVLKLRAVRANGDFDAYWHYHLARERERVHDSRYNGGAPAAAA